MKQALIVLSAVFSLMILTHPATADMYKWVDDSGATHYGDTPPQTMPAETIRTPDYPEPAPHAAPSAGNDGQQVHRNQASGVRPDYQTTAKKVEIYTTSWCKYCRRAIAFMRTNGVDFAQYDIEKDPSAMLRMMALGGKGGVPFAIIDGKPVQGFSEETYRRTLGLR